jgi:sugar O-acyltransferase (sialic acid O-acetyltransferase NeuD family)
LTRTGRGSPHEIHIVGTRSFAGEVSGFARDAGHTVSGLLEPLDPGRIGTTIHGLAVKRLEDGPDGDPRVLIGTGDPKRREIVARVMKAGWRPVSLIHPRAHLAPSTSVGNGALIGPGVVVGAYTAIGDHVVVGRGSLIGHHTEIGEFATLGPGANVAGNARLADDVFVGMAASVRDHISIGREAVIAMGAVVVDDVPERTEVRGIPARPHRRS